MNVLLSSDGTKVTKVIGEPVFHLSVCNKVTADGGANYDVNRQQEFGINRWDSFRDAEFNLKFLDPADDASVLKEFDAFADHVQRSRKVWR